MEKRVLTSVFLLLTVSMISTQCKQREDYSAEYDYVIVGAGAAGPVVASRLSENPDVTVAIFEAGGENANDLSRIPAAMSIMWGTDYDWAYNTVAQAHMNGRNIYHPRGKVVGGTTAINAGNWIRGTRSDYDSWEAVFGSKGWNFGRALEKFHIIEDSDRGPNEYRGRGGMVRVADAPNPSVISDKLVDAYVEAGFGIKSDYNAEPSLAAARMERIFPGNVRRTPADSYLSPEVRERGNLTVVTHAFVKRVLFNRNNKVIGIEVDINGKPEKIKVNKEVILSAGSFNTPKILMLSGVGPKAELEKHGIPVVADVPGVGENLKDHTFAFMKIVAPERVGSPVPSDINDKAIAEWRESRSGPAIYPTTNSVGFASMTDEITAPDFELMLGYTHGASGKESSFSGIRDLQSRSGYSIGMIQLLPESAGSVKLASADPYDAPVIDPQYFSDPLDMERFIRAIRKTHEITQTRAMAPYTEAVHPPLSATDRELEEFIRNETNSAFHPVGTVKMGDVEKDPMAVVDSSLRVRGVKGLRVADASVIPQVIRGHTMAPSIYVGEMAAEMIKKGR